LNNYNRARKLNSLGSILHREYWLMCEVAGGKLHKIRMS
jgi:hypothetical protein